MAINWEGLQSGIGDIGSSLAQYAREQRARQLALEDYKMKQQSELDQAIALAQAQSNIRKNMFQNDIYNNTPDGFEIVGYDQGGRPMVRKIKSNVAEMKFDLEQGEKEKQNKYASDMIKNSALENLNAIAEVEKNMDFFGMQGVIPAIPGTSKVNWESNIDKILSGKIINLMSDMKKASSTGATGFGQLSNKELGVLQNASTALKKTLKKEDAQRYLNDMKRSLIKVAYGDNESSSLGSINKFSGVENGNSKILDADTAKSILQQVGGDKEKARAMARQMGYQF
jgi:hypothetical protein